MPNIEVGEYTQDSTRSLHGVKYDYDYPDELDLRPQSKLHKKVLDYVLQRAIKSSAEMSNYYPKWNELDRNLTAYVDLTDSEKEVQENDNRKPVSIVVPHSYAILEATLGYMMSAFFQEPIFRYEGTSPDFTVGAILLTKVVDLHCNKTNVPLGLHTMWRDNFVYSFGAVTPDWDVKRGTRARKVAVRKGGMFNPDKIVGFEREVEEDAVLFEGNSLSNIDPYTVLPDPNYPIFDVKKSEYFGWVDRSNYYDMLLEEKDDEDIFNVKYLKHLHHRTSQIHKDNSSRSDRVHGKTKKADHSYTKPVDNIRMYVKIIPKDFELSDYEYPEVWFVNIAADSIITELRPVGTYQGDIPVEICCSEYDGYNVSPISRLEVLYGMQHTLDWMFSSHIHNVRKALNDVLIVDPYLINVPDLTDPGPGGIARLRRPAWGRGVKDAVQQLDITDVTQNNVRDVSLLMSFMDRISSTDSSMMGSLRQSGPERLTGQEFQGTRQAALNRLERVARIISLQAMRGIATQFASNTQQLMSEEVFVSVFGKWQELLMKEFGITDPQSSKIKVSPYDLLIDYDVISRDGTIPGGNYSPVFERMFEVIAKEPGLQQEFDLVRIFKHIARNNGAKNVDNFVKIKTQDDVNVQNQVQQGNLINLNEAGVA
jgi:hypothetical protein